MIAEKLCTIFKEFSYGINYFLLSFLKGDNLTYYLFNWLRIFQLFMNNLILQTFSLSVAPSLATTPADKIVLEYATATFHCSATGNPIPKITWIKDNNTVGQGETLILEAKRNDSGKYWCSAENGLNPTVNASASLDVQCKLMTVYFCNMSLISCIKTTMFGEYKFIDASICFFDCSFSSTKLNHQAI